MIANYNLYGKQTNNSTSLVNPLLNFVHAESVIFQMTQTVTGVNSSCIYAHLGCVDNSDTELLKGVSCSAILKAKVICCNTQLAGLAKSKKKCCPRHTKKEHE